MELSAEKISPLHAGAEGEPIVAARDRGGVWGSRVAVHEVGVVILLQALEQGRGAIDLERVPSHVRNRMLRVARQACRTARNDAETLRLIFLRGLEQQLHSEANAQHRLLQRRDQGSKLLCRSLDMACAAAPTPGKMTWLASRILRALVDTAEVVPSRCNANCSDAILAPPVAMITTLFALKHAFAAGHILALEANRLTQAAADALEAGLDHVVRVLAAHA